jgi:carboxyl-terminal processing protease
VNGVIPGGAAEAAGVVPGDRVLAVDGAPVASIGLAGAISRIRGAEGTPVRITLRRADGTQVELVVVRRRMRT